jgi:hypothetical protein
VRAGAGPVVIGSQGNLLIESVNAGGGSATLTSGTGAVLDGIHGGSNASHPNVIARAVTVNAATNAGNVNDALWVDAATISAAAAGGGVWIKDAAATPVTLASVRAGAGPVVIGSQGNLLIESVNAGGGSATLTSGTGAVLDGIGGGSNASHPNVIARTVTINAATNVGDPNDALWVNAATIYATATNGGVWINDAATTPVTLASVTAHAGPIVIHAQGDLDLLSVDAGSGGATLSSATGSILDAISGGATSSDPNVRAGTVTLTAANTIGLISDPIWVDAASYTANAPKGHWVNVPPVLTPYPDLPLLVGVSPVTVYEANAQAQILPPQQLPITLIGQPMRMAPPIAVTADLFGIALPAGVGANATQQDASMGTAIVPIYGGNDDEIGRKKATLRLKKNSDGRSTQNIVKTIKSEI